MPARYSNELTKNKTITFVNQYKSDAKLVIVVLISNYFEDNLEFWRLLYIFAGKLIVYDTRRKMASPIWSDDGFYEREPSSALQAQAWRARYAQLVQAHEENDSPGRLSRWQNRKVQNPTGYCRRIPQIESIHIILLLPRTSWELRVFRHKKGPPLWPHPKPCTYF